MRFSSVQSLSRVWLFATPWIAAHQASLSITNSRSSLRLMSIESVMPSSHLILCHPLLCLPPIPPSIEVFSNESTLHMMWPKYWSFSFSITPALASISIALVCWVCVFLLFDVETETPIFWPPDAKNSLTGKDPNAGKDWRREEKGMTEDEMVGWPHWLSGLEFE